MPTEDVVHPSIVRALVKDGWRIEKEQVFIRFGTRRLWIDLHISKPEISTILVEVKGFQAYASPVEALAQAVGQYIVYRAALRFREMGHLPLYLAVPNAIYATLFDEPIGEWTRREAALNLLIVDLVREEVVQWIPSNNA